MWFFFFLANFANDADTVPCKFDHPQDEKWLTRARQKAIITCSDNWYMSNCSDELNWKAVLGVILDDLIIHINSLWKLLDFAQIYTKMSFKEFWSVSSYQLILDKQCTICLKTEHFVCKSDRYMQAWNRTCLLETTLLELPTVIIQPHYLYSRTIQNL